MTTRTGCRELRGELVGEGVGDLEEKSLAESGNSEVESGNKEVEATGVASTVASGARVINESKDIRSRCGVVCGDCRGGVRNRDASCARGEGESRAINGS